MKRKKIIYGVVLLCLVMFIPVLFYVTNTGEKREVNKVAVKQQTGGVKAAKKQTEKKENQPVPDAETPKGNEQTTAQSVQENVVPGYTAETTTTKETKAVQADFLVVIDPGHQNQGNSAQEPMGPGATETKAKVTGGTSGVATGKPEYKFTLEASLALGKLLESRGVKVIYTRKTNEVNLSNRERAEIANQNHADLFVRIHADGSTDQNVHGLSVLTPAKNNPYTLPVFDDSLKASQFITEEISRNAAVKVNGISYRSDMAGFNWSKVPCTLIEMGFMTNPTEDKNLSDPVYMNNLLTNVADGIVKYVNMGTDPVFQK